MTALYCMGFRAPKYCISLKKLGENGNNYTYHLVKMKKNKPVDE